MIEEGSYRGEICCVPDDALQLTEAVFTEGSVSAQGGAAAVRLDGSEILLARVVVPRSSTHCELVALSLAMRMSAVQVVTDSLVALQLLRSWNSKTIKEVLRCGERDIVRYILHLAEMKRECPKLQKVKAHDTEALGAGRPQAVGNDLADSWAKRAATEDDVPIWVGPGGAYADPVGMVELFGKPVLDIQASVEAVWWSKVRCHKRARPRKWLELLYSETVAVDVSASVGIFRRPVVRKVFIYKAPPEVIKWTARVRTGCLATRLRLWERGLVECPACLRCGAGSEDEDHIFFGCSVQEDGGGRGGLRGCWEAVAARTKWKGPVPEEWLDAHRFQLVAAIIPASIGEVLGGQTGSQGFAERLHVALATWTADWLRRREDVVLEHSLTGSAVPPHQRQAGHRSELPPERRLAIGKLRALAKRQVGTARSQGLRDAATSTSTSRAPQSGEARRRWLKERLRAVILEDMMPCGDDAHSDPIVFLALFETMTCELFSETPGTPLPRRLWRMGAALSNLAKEGGFDPPLEWWSQSAKSKHCWNRKLRLEDLDVVAWRADQLEKERYAVPTTNLREQAKMVNAELAEWLRGHRYLKPDDDGEASAALLLLWEVDHGVLFPTKVGAELPSRLASFTSRLKNRVAADAELRGWLEHVATTRPLGTGLPGTYHVRWSVKVVKPKSNEPQGWYDDFVSRWQDYLQAVIAGQASRPATGAAVGSARRGQHTEEGAPATKRRRSAVAGPPVRDGERHGVEGVGNATRAGSGRRSAQVKRRRTSPSPVSSVTAQQKKAKTSVKTAVCSGTPVVSSRSRQTSQRGKAGSGRAVEGPGT